MHYHVLSCIYYWNFYGTFVVHKLSLPLKTLGFSGVYHLLDFNVGNRSTSLIAGELVSNITSLSIPYPIPPVGGIPISSAFKKSSSV